MNNNNDINNSSKSENISKKTKKKRKNSATKNYVRALVMLIIAIIVATGAFVLFSQTAKKAAGSAKEAYNNSKNLKSDEIYSEYYQNAYDKAEKKYHVSNRATIDITSIKELSNLEVLEVSDIEYVIREQDNDKGDIWLEYEGKGVYTIDMSLSEVITDNERSAVLVRVPSPTLTHVKKIKSTSLLYENKSFRNYSIKEGTDQAKEMESEGFEQVRTYMKTNSKFYESAENSAESLLTTLVKECNPDIPDLNVIIEFYD